MAPILLEDEPIARRTLGHDMESFFAVIIWMATWDYQSEAAFRAKPLATTLLEEKVRPVDIVNAKGSWFYKTKNFRRKIILHFTPYYRQDDEFVVCLNKLRRILYPSDDSDEDGNDSKERESADPMREDLFQMCMKEIDDYLHETKGVDEMQWIDSRAQEKKKWKSSTWVDDTPTPVVEEPSASLGITDSDKITGPGSESPG